MYVNNGNDGVQVVGVLYQRGPIRDDFAPQRTSLAAKESKSSYINFVANKKVAELKTPMKRSPVA